MNSQSSSRYPRRKKRYVKSLQSDSSSEDYSEDNGYDTSSSGSDSEDEVRSSQVDAKPQKSVSEDESNDSFDPSTSHAASDVESEEISGDTNSILDSSKPKDSGSGPASDSSRTPSSTSRYPIRLNRRVLMSIPHYS